MGMKKTVVILGSMDTKGEEYGFIKGHIEKLGARTTVIDVGVVDPPVLVPDVDRRSVIAAAGEDFDRLVARGPTREAISPLMAKGASAVIKRLISENKAHGLISCGGTQGSTLAALVMQELPVGFPKLLVSTMASGNTSKLVGIKDVTMMFSVADIMGLNRVTRKILARAAGAIFGMTQVGEEREEKERPLIAITTVGITTPGAMKAKEVLNEAGFDSMVFHAVGTGGRAMESLMREGMVDGVLDLATIEVVQELLGGYLAGPPDRLTVAGCIGIPQVICPGAVSCNTFGPPETIPERFRGRQFVRHSALYTNVRTNAEELVELAKIQAARVNPSKGPVEWYVPMKGFCSYSVEGGPLHNPVADRAYLETLKRELRPDIPVNVRELDINDPAFAVEVAERIALLVGERRVAQKS
jgi:uncharacterized protein (UPF0261 family)